MESYLMLFTAVILLACDFSVNKLYQQRAGGGVRAAFIFNAVNGLLTTLVFLCINSLRFELTGFSALLAIASAICSMLYSIIGFRMLLDGKVASYTLFLMTGGMTVPYLFGAVALNEQLSFLRIAGMILILAGMVLSNYSKERPNRRFILMGICVFLLNGIVGTITKVHQVDWGFSTVSSAGFVILSAIAKAVVSAIGLLAFSKSADVSKPYPFKRVILLIAGSAAIGGASFLLQLMSAKGLPATVHFPILCGGSIVFSALTGRLFFKEKLSPNSIMGISACFAGMLMFL